MAWGKVDDKLHASVKWRRATKGARALWTTALSWCSDQENDGSIPADMLRVLDGTRADATSLVRAGLWHETDTGWIFNDWTDYNPDRASIKAKREAESKGGKRGNHARWHVQAGVVVPDCEFCTPSGGESGTRSAPDQVGESGANPPVPTRPDPTQPKKKSSTSTTAADAAAFDEFWASYPRKEDKGRARPAWNKAIKKTDAQTITAAAKQYAATVDRKDGGKYIKLPATWLNAEAWENETPAGTVSALRQRPGRAPRMSDFTSEEWLQLPIEQRAAIAQRGQM